MWVFKSEEIRSIIKGVSFLVVWRLLIPTNFGFHELKLLLSFIFYHQEFCFLISWYNTMLLMTGVDDFINLLKAKVAVSGNFGV